ncbi:MAG TPA: hypothetical protein VFB81_01710, partial [Myxococcales bacterium]|nr:hypothetical protein [Myxococcales bacterium]
YLALERSLGPLALTVTDGQLTTVSGTFSTPPESALTVDWRTRDTTPGSFASFRTAIHPGTLGDLYEHDFFLAALPSGSYGFYGSAPDLVAMFLQDSARPAQSDQLITFSYRDPFPAAWTRFAEAVSVFSVPYDVPRTGTDGGTAFTTESAFLLALDALPAFPLSPLAPQVSPVTNPLVNGASWFSDQTLSGTTPLISWSAPAVGTPDFYSLRIRRVSAGPTGGVVKTEVARLVTRATSLRVPPGILQPGSYYLLRLTAAVQPGRTQTATYESPFPLHTAPVMSGVLRTP